MDTTRLIRNHINTLKRSQLVTTRDLLCYGSRGTVDKATSRLVNSGRLQRVARGVFLPKRRGGNETTIRDIALAKARAFRRTIVRHMVNIIGTTVTEGHQLIYSTNAFTSSFQTIFGRVYARKVTPRKIQLGDSDAGAIARTLWQIGSDYVTEKLVQKAVRHLEPKDCRELREAAGLVPAWLNEFFRDFILWRPRLVFSSS